MWGKDSSEQVHEEPVGEEALRVGPVSEEGVSEGACALQETDVVATGSLVRIV